MTLPPRQTTTPRNPGTLRAASSAIRAAHDDEPIGGNIAGCAELTDDGLDIGDDLDILEQGLAHSGIGTAFGQ
jgi:hypothetical protein